MGANSDERQRKAVEWFDTLEKYAEEKKLPMRIMDELEDCRGLVLSGEAEWTVVSRSVEELLESIEGKTAPAVVQEKAENEVTAEDVRAQLEKMARRCHAENTASVDSMGERKNAVIQKMYGQLSDISRTKAHLEELKNEDLYLQFFSQCKAAYERDTMDMIRELLQSVGNNYGYMLNHMRSMFQSIGGYKKGLGNEKFYLEYESRRNGIDQRILGEAQTADVGGSDLTFFGQRTKDTVRKIVKKLVQKRKVLAWVPLLVLICLFVGFSVARQEQNRQTVEQAAEMEEQEDSPIKDIALDLGKKAVKSASASVWQAVGATFSALIISLGAMVIFLILFVIVLYLCYLKLLKWWCNHQIRKRCGEYLKTELSRFERENELSLKLDAAMLHAVDEYERLYLEVLNQLLMGTGYGEQKQQDEMTEWNALRGQWDEIKHR